MMSRKDYTKFAALLSGELAVHNGHAATLALRSTVYGLADILAQDNPNFDRARFYAAIGGGFGNS